MITPRLHPDAILAELRRCGRDRCVLCGGRPARVVIWTPTPEYSRRLGAPPGKHRVAMYCLCKKCVRRVGVATLVENKLLADAGDGRRN